jgi:hypothetical protein
LDQLELKINGSQNHYQQKIFGCWQKLEAIQKNKNSTIQYWELQELVAQENHLCELIVVF